MVATSLNAIEMEELHDSVRKALGIALAMSEAHDVDEHNRFTACAIVDYLKSAQRMLEGEDAEVTHA
jgi:hypothetical protein